MLGRLVCSGIFQNDEISYHVFQDGKTFYLSLLKVGVKFSFAIHYEDLVESLSFSDDKKISKLIFYFALQLGNKITISIILPDIGKFSLHFKTIMRTIYVLYYLFNIRLSLISHKVMSNSVTP